MFQCGLHVNAIMSFAIVCILDRFADQFKCRQTRMASISDPDEIPLDLWWLKRMREAERIEREIPCATAGQ